MVGRCAVSTDGQGDSTPGTAPADPFGGLALPLDGISDGPVIGVGPDGSWWPWFIAGPDAESDRAVRFPPHELLGPLPHDVAQRVAAARSGPIFAPADIAAAFRDDVPAWTPTCGALTVAGSRCRRPTLGGRCWQHASVDP